MIVYLGTDLMMASAIGAVARSNGGTLRSVAAVEKLLELLAANEEIELVVVNLQLPGLDIADLGNRLAERVDAGMRLIWFGQHVYGDLLDSARNTGVGTVMTRGQLNNKLPDLIGR